MVEHPGNQEHDEQRRPSDQNIGAQQRHDRGSENLDAARPRDHQGPEGRDVPPSDAPRDSTSPWMGGG